MAHHHNISRIVTTNLISTNLVTDTLVSDGTLQGSRGVTAQAYAYYKFNGDATDSGGGGYDLTNTTLTYSTSVKKVGTHSIGGLGQVTRASPFLSLEHDDPFTMETWLRLGDVSAESVYLLYKHSGQGYKIYFQNGVFYVTFEDNAGPNNILSVEYSSLGAEILNTWTHLAVTYDGSGLETGIKVYVNGILYTTNRTTPSTDTLTGTIINTSVLNIFTAGVASYCDNFAVYLEILSPDEIVERYNNGEGVESADVTSYRYKIDDVGVLLADKIYIGSPSSGTGTAILRDPSTRELVETTSTLASKTNIRDLSPEDIAWIDKINVKKYNYRIKESETTYSKDKFKPDIVTGIIAEDLVRYKGAVRHCLYQKGELYSINYMGMIGDMIKYMQKLREEIDELKNNK